MTWTKIFHILDIHDVFDIFERQRKNDDERVIIAAKNSFMMRFALICLIAPLTFSGTSSHGHVWSKTFRYEYARTRQKGARIRILKPSGTSAKMQSRSHVLSGAC